jgi:hypothetical protein
MAEVCDQARTLWMIGQGTETATAAMNQLGINPLIVRATEENDFWQGECDTPDLSTLLARKQRQEARQIPQERPEWIVVPRAQDYATSSTLPEALKQAIALDTRAMIMLWPNSNSPQNRTQQDQLQTFAESINWKCKVGIINNEEHGGLITTASYYLLAAPTHIIDIIGEKRFETNDGPAGLAEVLDSNDGIFSDCFRWQQKAQDAKDIPTGPFQSRARTFLHVHDGEGQPHTVPIFDRERPGPNLSIRTNCIGSKAFAIEATDGITSQKARPII